MHYQRLCMNKTWAIVQGSCNSSCNSGSQSYTEINMQCASCQQYRLEVTKNKDDATLSQS